MTKEELERGLSVGRAHSVVVDVREVQEAPGNVRTVTVHRGNRVTIEYDKTRAYIEGNYEGGGLKYVAQYVDLDDVVTDLEEYLGAKIPQWINYTESRFLPGVADDPDPVKSLGYFEDLVRQESVALPRRAKYEIAGVYWRHIAKYGQYREDKLLEEQEEQLRQYEE
jgi:hypothetical protein